MTGDQQKQPESESSRPQRPPGKAAGKAVGRAKKLETPSFLKTQTLKVLRGTIGLLEGVVEKLEAEPLREISPQVASPAKTVAASVVDSTTATPETELVSRTSESIPAQTPAVTPESISAETPVVTPEVVSSETLAVTPEVVSSETLAVTPEVVSSETPAVIPEVVTQETPVAHASQEPPPRLLDRILPTFDKLQTFWDTTLAKVRSLLPAAWNQKLSDWALTSAIAGIVVLIMVTTATLLPDTPAQVAKAPPNSIEAPPELKAPQPPQPVEEVPPPQPELTPEQSLVAAIQQQVAEITDRYGNGLIQSVEANFLASRLMVKVSDRWYELKASQQNKLADEILHRSRELDFSRLEITDLEGTLVARTPVVGSNMVILKRQELAAK